MVNPFDKSSSIKLIRHHVPKTGVEKARACPVCPRCGYKKFDRVKTEGTVVKCLRCGTETAI